MKNVFAFIVGIDRYEEPDWSLPGPCRNALDIANTLIECNISPSNVFLFLDVRDNTFDDEILNLVTKGVNFTSSAKFDEIDTFWRETLPNEVKETSSRLLFYWSGHGIADHTGRRMLMCSDYTSGQLTNRIFNCSNFLLYLRSDRYQRFSEQIILVDACANIMNLEIDPNNSVPDNRCKETSQIAFFAAREDEYAKGEGGQGFFTGIARKVLDDFLKDGWLAFTNFSEAMEDSFNRHKGEIFYVTRCDIEKDTGIYVGTNNQSGEQEFFTSAYGILSSARLSDTVYRSHYVKTVSDLGQPALYSAQGLTGMLRELSSLCDSDSLSPVPFGFLNFMVRLGEEEVLKTPITYWLGQYAIEQAHEQENIQERIRCEREVKILVVEVTNDQKGQVEAFQVFVRTQELYPVANCTYEAKIVNDWPNFCQKLVVDINDIQKRHSIADFEVHFLVDPPLFDRPFHQIDIGDGRHLGDEHVVVLRHGRRVRLPSTSVIAKLWKKNADALRASNLDKLKLVPVSPSAVSREAPRLGLDGLCYLTFVVQSTTRPVPGLSSEKKALQQLLCKGVPYLYWLHKLPASGAIEDVEPEFTDWLQQSGTLDKFPGIFTEGRARGNYFACNATLLWDDPQFNPFQANRKVSLK